MTSRFDDATDAHELRVDNLFAAIERFRCHGMNASFHYASEAAGELEMATRERNKALVIFDSYPEGQGQMRKLAEGFLWASQFARLRPDESQAA